MIGKWYAKKQIKKAKKIFLERKEQKLIKNYLNDKEKIENAILEMAEMFEIKEDNGTIVTKESLKEKNLTQLETLFEEILNEAERAI